LGAHGHPALSKVISEIQAMEIKSLKLYFFGEPLLYPEIGEILRIATAACGRVELTTNGMPMTAKQVQEIVDANVDEVRVAIDDHISHPENVVRNVRLLWDARQACGASKPFIFVKVFDQAQAESIRTDYEGICDEIGSEELHSIGSDMIQIKRLTGAQVACPYPFYNLVVKSNGDVVPCCVACRKSLVVGNARDQTLAEIWRGKRVAEIDRLHLSGTGGELADCANCDTFFNCPDSVDSLRVEEYERRRASAVTP
jgi:radical SAM protein with 4Fe4S-binding SPASM domain